MCHRSGGADQSPLVWHWTRTSILNYEEGAMSNKALPLLIAALFALSCVRSLQPLYTGKDLVFRKELLGTWKEADGSNTWRFEQAGPRKYRLTQFQRTYQEGFMKGDSVPGDSAVFDAHLVQLGDYLFLDVFPEPLTCRNDYYKIHFLPVHTFTRLWIEESRLTMSMMDGDWLKKLIDEGKLKIAHETIHGQIVLTASTAVLQRLVISFAEDEEAFPEPGELVRVE